jgi:hypothetical protein
MMKPQMFQLNKVGVRIGMVPKRFEPKNFRQSEFKAAKRKANPKRSKKTTKTNYSRTPNFCPPKSGNTEFRPTFFRSILPFCPIKVGRNRLILANFLKP